MNSTRCRPRVCTRVPLRLLVVALALAPLLGPNTVRATETKTTGTSESAPVRTADPEQAKSVEPVPAEPKGTERPAIDVEAERERAHARKVREKALAERDRFLEDYRRSVEAKAAREKEARREEHLRRVDPERGTFWRRELVTYFGRELLLFALPGSDVIIFAQGRSQQFTGYRAHARKLRPRLKKIRVLGRADTSISDYLKNIRGNFVVLSVPEGQSETAVAPGRYELLRLQVHGQSFDITNIFSDGSGLLRIEAERSVREGHAGDYARWTVDTILLERK